MISKQILAPQGKQTKKKLYFREGDVMFGWKERRILKISWRSSYEP